LLARAGKAAFGIIEAFVKDLNIECDLESKFAWLYSENEKERKQLQEILEVSKRVGVEVEPTDKNIVPVPFQSVIRFSGQGQFHPLKYIQGLLAEFIALGGILMERTRIMETSLEDGIYTAKSDDSVVKSRNLVYATHIPPGVNLMSFRNAPYRSYAEYVFSIPNGLKNVIEWCVATTVFADKPSGLITASANGQKGHEELLLIMKTAMAKFTSETTLLI